MYLILLSMLFPTHYINELSSYQIPWFILDNLFIRMCGHFTLAPMFYWSLDVWTEITWWLYFTIQFDNCVLSNMCREHKMLLLEYNLILILMCVAISFYQIKEFDGFRNGYFHGVFLATFHNRHFRTVSGGVRIGNIGYGGATGVTKKKHSIFIPSAWKS